MHRLILAVALALAVSACSKVDQEHYSKIENGMTEEQVYDILGKPSEASSRDFLGVTTTSAKWTSGDAVIIIQFVDGKVLLRSFDKPRGR
ncbi:MAG: outer membrane protein assembly factor BamE [Burkholderiales bacterium]